MVEILVAMIIALILMAALVLALNSAKSGTRAKEGYAAAQTYALLVSKYQGDHANKLPGVDGEPAMHPTLGPLNLLGQRYMTAPPDGVAARRIAVVLNSCATPPTTSLASTFITYCSEPAPNFGIRVTVRKNNGVPWTGTGAKQCWLGSTAKSPRCP